QSLKLLGNTVALESGPLLAVDVDRSDRSLSGSWQADADVRVLALAGPVHDASHHRDGHVLDPFVLLAPNRHLLTDVRLDFLRELLEVRRCGASTTRACDHHRHERPQTHGLQNL